jgi:hypothetical protein
MIKFYWKRHWKNVAYYSYFQSLKQQLLKTQADFLLQLSPAMPEPDLCSSHGVWD